MRHLFWPIVVVILVGTIIGWRIKEAQGQQETVPQVPLTLEVVNGEGEQIYVIAYDEDLVKQVEAKIDLFLSNQEILIERVASLEAAISGEPELDPRWWVPDFVRWLSETNKPVMPHLGAYHKHRELPGKPYVLQTEANIHYTCEMLCNAGHKHAMVWLVGSTDADYEAQLPFIDIVKQYF